jgi:hypothetical protein
LYNEQPAIKKYQEKISKILGACKSSLRECIELEDYESEGFVSYAQLKECFETLELFVPNQIDDDTFDYIVYVLYQKSEGLDKLNYQLLFEMIEGKLL